MKGLKFIAKTRVLNMSHVEVTFLTNPACSKCSISELMMMIANSFNYKLKVMLIGRR